MDRGRWTHVDFPPAAHGATERRLLERGRERVSLKLPTCRIHLRKEGIAGQRLETSILWREFGPVAVRNLCYKRGISDIDDAREQAVPLYAATVCSHELRDN